MDLYLDPKHEISQARALFAAHRNKQLKWCECTTMAASFNQTTRMITWVTPLEALQMLAEKHYSYTMIHPIN